MKVDISKIDGYESMTVEEKVAALEAFELPESSADEIGKLKGMIAKKNSEIANITKELRAKQSDEEKAEADRLAKEAEKDARIAELEKAQKLADYKTRYMAIGFDAEEASKQAEALIGGDLNSIFEAHKAHNDTIKTSAIAEAMTKQKLSNGNPPGSEAASINNLRKAMGLPII